MMNIFCGNLKDYIVEQLQKADIVINGSRPWDIVVHDERFYQKIIAEGSIGFGDSYVAGWWDSERLDECIFRIMIAQLDETFTPNIQTAFYWLKAVLLNLQSKNRAFIVGRQHYDRGNELFIAMLDKRLCYSCAYWKDAETLDQAQENKLDLICRKIGLRPGMKVLDIGCGWGSFAKYAAEKYQAHVLGITVSQEQLNLGRELCRGLSVELELKDYREITGEYDAIVSIGQMEHVGWKNYRTYFEIVRRSLKDNGFFLLHTIGSNRSWKRGEPWIQKHIFPNGITPSIVQLSQGFEGLFQMEDWHNFGVYYDRTLMAWHHNFESHRDSLNSLYDEQFHRMWNYYLLSCAGAFRARHLQLWQIVLSKNGLLGGYQSIR